MKKTWPKDPFGNNQEVNQILEQESQFSGRKILGTFLLKKEFPSGGTDPLITPVVSFFRSLILVNCPIMFPETLRKQMASIIF